MATEKKKLVHVLQEFSVPLILGVFMALGVANNDYDFYHKLIHTPLTQFAEVFGGGGEHHDAHDSDPVQAHESETADAEATGAPDAGAHAEHGGHGWEHFLTLHFLVNDLFMVVFFGIAAKEITESCLPGGALNPLKNAINPLLGTIGGVVGPVGAYFLLNGMIGDPAWSNGWGIPTATDIALAWLVARLVFGVGHPAISFLLLLAIADDGIGLAIIALAYPDPSMPTEWANALWILPGMAIAYFLRWQRVRSWIPYVVFGGIFSWMGLYSAHLHPALALVFIVPFIPGPNVDLGFYEEEVDYDAPGHDPHSPLEQFEHQLKMFVDFGLFFFAFANAGVPLAGVNALTWVVFLALLLGKTVGITAFSYIGALCGIPLPKGMEFKHLLVAAIVAGIGLTVALFVSGEAFTDPGMQGAAKMGALLSGFVAAIAIFVGRALKVKDHAGSMKS